MDELWDSVLEDYLIEVTSVTVTETEVTSVATVETDPVYTDTEPTEDVFSSPVDVPHDIEQTDITDDFSSDTAVLGDYDFQAIYDLLGDNFSSINKNHKAMIEDYETIIENQEAAIALLQEQNNYIFEMHSVLVNFFFCFMVLMVCKFVHFLFYKVFFGGIT